VRGEAILGRFPMCAHACGTEATIADLTLRWPTIASGLFPGRCSLQSAGSRGSRPARAAELARAEVETASTARALYVWARCAELAGEDAAFAYAETIERAKNEGASALERAARARRALLLAASWTTREEALAEASRVDVTSVEDVGLAALLAGVLLQSPSRFVRASAVDALATLGTGPMAIALVARYGPTRRRSARSARPRFARSSRSAAPSSRPSRWKTRGGSPSSNGSLRVPTPCPNERRWGPEPSDPAARRAHSARRESSTLRGAS
jgi:hypothetical protein